MSGSDQNSPYGGTLLAPQERVLSTLNSDGSRRWLRPRPSPGRFLNQRRVVGWFLIALFTLLPHLRWNGRPLVLLDLPARQFTLLGTTFLPTDALFLALAVILIFLGIFLITALFGRVWCGWGCPQTVYMELVYRPIERLFEGRNRGAEERIRQAPWRTLLKWVCFVLVSAFLAHTFLAYFVGTDNLRQWMTRSPLEHPGAFALMASVTLLMLVDFGFMREQVCLLMCPYGRLQSALLDRSSLIIGYDRKRGEPRGKLGGRNAQGEPHGDCVACGLCVETCPTGIDIRDGLQMECIGCAQCIDACDAVMERVGKKKGLIRYSSQEAMETGQRKLMRARVILYPLLMLAFGAGAGFLLLGRHDLDVSFLRARQAPFQRLEDGRIGSRLEFAVTNRTRETGTWSIQVADGLALAGSPETITLDPLERQIVLLRLAVPEERFERGRTEVTLDFVGPEGRTRRITHPVIGPLRPQPSPR